MRPHIALDGRTALEPSFGHTMHRLKIDPEFGAGAEEACEPQGGVRRYRPLAFDDRANARCGHAQRQRERIRRHLERIEKFLLEDLPRMGGHATRRGYRLSSKQEPHARSSGEWDLAIGLDADGSDRLGSAEAVVTAQRRVLDVDHHTGEPYGDLRGSVEYKRNAIRVLTERGLRHAAESAREEPRDGDEQFAGHETVEGVMDEIEEKDQ